MVGRVWEIGSLARCVQSEMVEMGLNILSPEFHDRIYTLDSATLTNSQKMALNLTIVKLRSMSLEKTKKLKVPMTVAA